MKQENPPEAIKESGPIKPRLGSFDLTMIVVSLVIGMGIFSTPHDVSVSAKVPLVYFLAWITGGVASFLGALTFAEIGSRYPAAGGFYKIFSHCYHPAFAFMVNWITVISNAASTAGVAILGAEYIYPLLLPGWEHDEAVRTITISSVTLLYIINFLGIKVSAKFLNVLMIIKISLLLLLISAVFIPHHQAASSSPAMSGTELFSAFLLCFSSVFFTYGGYQQTMNFGSDVSQPSRTMPRAIFLGMGIVLLLYLAVNYSYVSVLGFGKLQSSATPAADLAGAMMGDAAYYFIAIVMFLSVMAYVNVSVLSNPRVYYAMAEDGVLPPILKRVNQRTQVQEYALSLFCAFILITIFFLASFKKIVDYVMFFDSISLATAAAAIFILRYRAKKSGTEPSQIFKMKGYPFIPAVYILIYSGVLISIVIARRETATNAFYLFASGLPLFYVMRFLIRKGVKGK